MASLLHPLAPLTGQEPFWQAEGTDPWFQLDLDCPAAGGWLALAWETSLADPVDRPMLAFLGSDGDIFADAILAGTAFGRQATVVPVPAGTRAIRFSPGRRAGSYGFRMIEARWISAAAAFLRGLANQPFMALHALGAALIRRPWDFRLLLTEAIQTVPLARYVRWKRQRSRQPDWLRFDRVEPAGLPAIHVLGLDGRNPLPPTSSLPEGLRATGAGLVPGTDIRGALPRALVAMEDSDLVILLPAGAEVLPLALPALARAAAEAPDAVLFFGDEEVGQPAQPRFLTGFDPLWSFRALAGSAACAVRAGTLRCWLANGEVPACPRGVALSRPLVARSPQVVLPPVMAECLAALAKAWPASRGEAVRASIIIPTRDRLELLRACIDSLEPTIPAGSEIIVIDNDSEEPATHEYLRDLVSLPGRKVLPVAGAFNFSRLCNLGVREASGDVLVFLNNDTTIVTPDWLTTLARLACQPDIGAVGARLLYPSGRVQHAGIVMGMGGFAGHVDLHLAGDSDGTFGRARANHAATAVTGACLAVERRKFEAIGGFDEDNLPVDLNDIDLCLRLAAKGWRNILAADAVLVHYESASRGRTSAAPRYARERAYFAARWRSERRHDPFYHPALSLQLTRVTLG